jgi:hypothetical protein
VNKPKRIGTAAETAVSRYLQAHGFPHAERRALRGIEDAGDITGCPGVCIEVKGGKAAESASDLLVADWLEETETERLNARADVGVLVLKRKGVGAANAGRWWAIVRGDTLTRLIAPDASIYSEAPLPAVRMLLIDLVSCLRWAGYGNPLADNPDYEEASA